MAPLAELWHGNTDVAHGQPHIRPATALKLEGIFLWLSRGPGLLGPDHRKKQLGHIAFALCVKGRMANMSNTPCQPDIAPLEPMGDKKLECDLKNLTFPHISPVVS